MKEGRSLMDLVREIERQATAKRDFVSDTRLLDFLPDGRLVLPVGQEMEDFGITDLAHRQIAERLKIPAAYYDRMRNEAPELLASNVNTWFGQNPERRMVRTLDGNVRAFLSDRYRVLDNYDLAEAVLPIISGMDAKIVSCEITDTKLYLKVLNEGLQADIKVGDMVQAGMIISNSEVGRGSVSVEPLIYRLVCKNGLIASDFSLKKYHVGRAADEGNAYEIFRDETLQADDRAFMLKVQDVVRTAVDELKFGLIVQRMRETTEAQIKGDPVKAVEVVSNKLGLNGDERGGMLRHLIQGGDLSQWGVVNAVTRLAQDVDDYDRAIELERMGGKLLILPKRDWQEIAGAA